ncbi:hypothetical protein [Chitinimonas sp.]|uniref:hypothetical protein n=1 Tax=Chitinimonas sp. TaxID=1934313 RepID=UPI002F94B006
MPTAALPSISNLLLLQGGSAVLLVFVGAYAVYRLWRHSKALAVFCAGLALIGIAWQLGYADWLEGIVQAMAVLAALGMAHDGWQYKRTTDREERKQYRRRYW